MTFNFGMRHILFGIVFTMYQASTNAGGLKILGGFTDVLDVSSNENQGRTHEWGLNQTGQPGTDVLTVTKSYCWYAETNSRAYCNQNLIVSTKDDPNEEYYEILGSKLVVMNGPSKYIDTTIHQYEQQFADVENGESDVWAYSGESWSPGNNAWGYAYLHFIVKKSTRQPVTDAFSTEARDAGNEQFSQAEEFSGSKDPKSTRATIGEFRCSTTAWGEESNCYTYIWRAETKLVSYSLRYDDKQILEVTEVPKVRPLILENHGSGLSALEFPRIDNEETIKTSSTASFSKTFDFAIDVSTEIGFDAFGASASVGFNSHFGFSTTSDLSKSVENAQTMKIKWPSKCDPGFRVTYKVAEHSEKQKIPMDFTFERAKRNWNETNDVVVTLKWIEIHADDCCLHDYANEKCGSVRLPMC